MQRLEVSGAVRPIYGSLGVKRLKIFHTYFNYLITQFANQNFRGKLSNFMYSIDVNTLGSQCVHNVL